MLAYTTLALCISSSLLVHSVTSQHYSQSGQQQQQKTAEQYPRIKLGGPLGQLVPNGFQLGQQFGSLVNQLIGTAESAAIPAPANSPIVSALIPRHFKQQHAQQHVQQSHAPYSHQQSMSSQASPQWQQKMPSMMESYYSSLGQLANSGSTNFQSPQLGSMAANLFNH